MLLWGCRQHRPDRVAQLQLHVEIYEQQQPPQSVLLHE